MTLRLKRGVICAAITLAALWIPTPAMAAESGLASDASRVQPAGVCEILPILWWCKK
ncbi:MAG: hypothetical protein J0I14_06880 [Propionibacteriaceae bacterium]|jgi:hypothetical protein|nr:hypothetical protein [Propionibacteriaceae bacterium]